MMLVPTFRRAQGPMDQGTCWSLPRPVSSLNPDSLRANSDSAPNAFGSRLAALSLVASGILFVLYPAIRPFSDESSLQGAEAFASSAWVLAFILLALGPLGLYLRLQATTAARRSALLALVLGWTGVGLTLPYYGAEAFGLHAVGQEALTQHNAALLSLVNSVR